MPTPSAQPPLSAKPWSVCRHSDWWFNLSQAERSVLIPDYDGTLAPFVRERMQAKPYAGVVERMSALSQVADTRLAIVSGRPIDELPALLHLPVGVEFWGSHGRERLRTDGRYELVPVSPAQRSGLDQLMGKFEPFGYRSGIEPKAGSVAVHIRGRPRFVAKAIMTIVEFARSAIFSSYGLEVLPFSGGVEIRAKGCTKATAVTTILAEEEARRPAAYLGDDQTDEDAFRAINGRGLSILVRQQVRASAAQFWLQPPEELLDFFDLWLRAGTRDKREAAA